MKAKYSKERNEIRELPPSAYVSGDMIIPDITHPLGKGWNQPKTADIFIDDSSAFMSEKVLEALLEYSASIPTGVYEGKIWKAQAGDRWYLKWFGFAVDPNKCSINIREIHVAKIILCSPEAKQIWEDGREVEEGKDFRIDFQFMSTPDYDFKWQSCSEEDYKMTNPKYKRTMAIPAIKDEQDELWEEVKTKINDVMWHEACENDEAAEEKMNEIKQTYSLTRK